MVHSRVIALIADAADVEPGSLALGTLFTSLPLDSLEFMQLMQDVETEFSVKVENQDIASLLAIQDLCRLIDHKQAA